MNHVITRIFVRGLVTLLPLLVTVLLVIWITVQVEQMLATLLAWTGVYFPGMGLLLLTVLVFIVGLFIDSFLIRHLYSELERLLDRVPLVKSVYGAMKDLQSFMVQSGKKKTGGVVVVRFPAQGPEGHETRFLGFLTRTSFDDVPPGLGEAETVAVYLPMSYQIGGFTVMVPKSCVTLIDMSAEDALRFALTAGMSAKGPDAVSGAPDPPTALAGPPSAQDAPKPPMATTGPRSSRDDLDRPLPPRSFTPRPSR